MLDTARPSDVPLQAESVVCSAFVSPSYRFTM